jgi:hypothetical protein
MYMARVWIRKDTEKENLLEEVAFIRSRGEAYFINFIWRRKICKG